MAHWLQSKNHFLSRSKYLTVACERDGHNDICGCRIRQFRILSPEEQRWGTLEHCVWIQKMMGPGTYLIVWSLFLIFVFEKKYCLNWTQILKLENNKKLFSSELNNWPMTILQLTQQCTVFFFLSSFFHFSNSSLSLSNGNMFFSVSGLFVLDWLAVNLCFDRPLKTHQLLLCGLSNTQKTLLFRLLSPVLERFDASS